MNKLILAGALMASSLASHASWNGHIRAQYLVNAQYEQEIQDQEIFSGDGTGLSLSGVYELNEVVSLDGAFSFLSSDDDWDSLDRYHVAMRFNTQVMSYGELFVRAGYLRLKVDDGVDGYTEDGLTLGVGLDGPLGPPGTKIGGWAYLDYLEVDAFDGFSFETGVFYEFVPALGGFLSYRAMGRESDVEGIQGDFSDRLTSVSVGFQFRF